MAFSISGSTLTSGAAAISGVTVTAFNYPSGTTAGSTTSDGSGNYTISNLAAGDYTLTAVLPGWVLKTARQVSGVVVSQPAGVAIISANVTGVNFTATNAGILSFSGGFAQNGTSGTSVASFAVGPKSVSNPGIAIVVVRNGSGNGNPTSVTGSLGNTYTLNYSYVDNQSANVAIYISNTTNAGSETCTVNFSPNTSFASGSMWVLSNTVGLSGTFSTVQVDNKTTAGPATAADSNSISSQVPLSFVICNMGNGSGVAATTGRGGLDSTLDGTSTSFSRNWGHHVYTSSSPTTSTYGMNSGSASTITINTVILGWLTNGIRGNCGVGGATVNFSGPRSGSVTADLAGNYYIPFAGTADLAAFTITPSASGITFSPTNNSVTPSALGSDTTGPTFTGTTTITVAPTYSVTETTIVATWTTAGACDSNIFASGKAGLDNGLPCAETNHVAIVTGLLPGTRYSCSVKSLDQTSSTTLVTTSAQVTRYLLNGVSAIGTSNIAASSTGDTYSGFVSNDANEYTVRCDGVGYSGGTSANFGFDKISTLSPLTGTQVNALTDYGSSTTTDGQDNITSIGSGSTKKLGGNPLSIAGNLFIVSARQSGSPSFVEYRGGIMMSPDKGVTWGNWQNPGVFASAAIEQNPPMAFAFGNNMIGWASPIRYAADNGTLGYNVAGNGFDGGNGWVYFLLFSLNSSFGMTLMRAKRRAFIPLMSVWQSTTPYAITYQYWTGPAAPSIIDFVNDNNWSTTFAGTTTIYSYAGTFRPHITFIPGINTYIFSTGGTPWNFATAPTPAGPWTSFYTGNAPSVSGTPDLNEPCPLHSDVIANVSTTTLNIRFMHAAPPGAHYNLRLSSGTTLTASSVPVPPATLGTAFDILFEGRLYVSRVVSGL